MLLAIVIVNLAIRLCQWVHEYFLRIRLWWCKECWTIWQLSQFTVQPLLQPSHFGLWLKEWDQEAEIRLACRATPLGLCYGGRGVGVFLLFSFSSHLQQPAEVIWTCWHKLLENNHLTEDPPIHSDGSWRWGMCELLCLLFIVTISLTRTSS